MENVREQYNRNGFALFRSFFDKRQIQQIRSDAKLVFRNQMLNQKIIESPEIDDRQFEQAMFKYFREDIDGFINCGKTCQNLISLHRLALTDAVLEKLKWLGLQTPNICTRPVIYFNSRHLATTDIYYKTPAHQDWRSMQGSLNAVVVWAPLIDIDENLGALQVIPGSHLWGLQEAEMDHGFGHIKEAIDDRRFQSIEVKEGDALFFSAFLIHRSGDNRTESIRWSCHFRYNDLSEPTFINRKYPAPYIYKPQKRLITQGFPDRGVLARLFE